MNNENLDQILRDLHALFNSDRDAMIAKCELLLTQDAEFAPALMMLGLAAFMSGDEGLAINFLENAHQINPECKEYVDLLAAFLPRAGRVSDSLFYGKLSVALQPHPILKLFVPRELSSYKMALDQARVSSHNMVAELALRSGQYQQALQQSDEELRINPNNAEALIISARALLALGKPRAALNTLRAASHVAPRSGWLHGWFAATHIAAGRHSAALPHLRLALDYKPGDLALTALVAGLTDWLDDAGWNATQSVRQALVDVVRQGRGTRTGDQFPHTQMIGFFSDQWHEGPLAPFVLPVLKDVKNSVLYRGNQRHDLVTKSFQHAAMRLRECAEVDKFTLGRTMVGDSLEVIFYLGNPSHESKYIHFAGDGGPAAVQWLGEALTDRLPTAELVVGDGETLDVDLQNFGPHQVVTLDHMVAYAFSEIPAEDEQLTPSPRETTGTVTFGAWGDLRRLTPDCFALWSQCVLAVPGSTLLLGGRRVWEDGVLQWLHDNFAEYGIGPRVRSHPLNDDVESPLAFWADVDVMLDAVPVSAGAEAAQALWMGVPVITCKGPRRSSRFAASVLRAAGFPQWIATTGEDYVSTAAETAQSPDLPHWRQDLRAKVLASPLADAATLSDRMIKKVLAKLAGGVPGRGS